MQYSVLSKQTAFVAVQRRKGEVASDTMHLRSINFRGQMKALPIQSECSTITTEEKFIQNTKTKERPVLERRVSTTAATFKNSHKESSEYRSLSVKPTLKRTGSIESSSDKIEKEMETERKKGTESGQWMSETIGQLSKGKNKLSPQEQNEDYEEEEPLNFKIPLSRSRNMEQPTFQTLEPLPAVFSRLENLQTLKTKEEMEEDQRRKEEEKRREEEEKSKEEDSPEEMKKILFQQRANGSWPLITLDTFSADRIKKYITEHFPTSNPHETQILFMTLLVLSWLKNKFPGYKDNWDLIAEKANRWIKRSSDAEKISQLVETFYLANKPE